MLSLSSDRKTAPSCKWETNQRRWKPRTLNAIGFPAVTTCPSRTPTWDPTGVDLWEACEAWERETR